MQDTFGHIRVDENGQAMAEAVANQNAPYILKFAFLGAAVGAYLIPKIFATQIKAGTPQYALYGFAGYYASCLFVNWWFYARKNAEIKC